MSLLETALSVVMVGHSLFGPTGPTMLEQALEAGGAKAEVQAQIINGAPLNYNWNNASQAEGINARVVLPEGKTTHLILTEAVPLEGHLQWSNTIPAARNFATLARAANPETVIYVQETWHSLLSGTGVSVPHDPKGHIPWRKRLSDDLPRWQSIVDGVSAAMPTAQVELIPAGQAMALLHDEIAAGKAGPIADIRSLFDDHIHLSHTGHYFVTMVQYGVLTGVSPVGLPANFKTWWGQPYDLPEPEVVAILQDVAWRAVTAHRGEVTIAPATAEPAKPEQTHVAARAPPVKNDRAIGLAPVSDWGTQVPFLNLMKTARPWIGHKPGQWGGMGVRMLREGGYLDADGWPLRMPEGIESIGTLILTEMPREAQHLAGRYRLTYAGKGVVEVGGLARDVRYAPGMVEFSYAPGPGAVDIRMRRIDPGDPLRIDAVVKVSHLDRFAAGETFNPLWTARIGQFSTLRFMDWMETNNAHLSQWADRPRVSDVTYAGGVPVEVMIHLANETQTNPWFTVPHLADDDFVTAFAEMVRDRLDPGLKVYVEFSNEVWNGQFAQARWAAEMARARWGRDHAGMQYYALRAAEVARIWTGVFGAGAEARLVNVISSQTGWLGLENQVFDGPLLRKEGVPPVAEAFDAYAITGYFSARLGGEQAGPMIEEWLAESREMAKAAGRQMDLSEAELEVYVGRHAHDHAIRLAAEELRAGTLSGDPTDSIADLAERVWPYHAQVAQRHGLDLIMYEGGTHVTGFGPRIDDAALTEFFHHLNYAPEMGVLYQQLISEWEAVGGTLFNAYSDVSSPSKWGSWGALRHLDDANPRWEALTAWP